MILSPSELVGQKYREEAKGPHVESYFLKANDPKSRRALWLKATIFAPADGHTEARTELWAIAFDGDGAHCAVKETLPFAAGHFDRAELRIAAKSVTILADHTSGDLTFGDRRVTWDLSIASSCEPLVHFPERWMYTGPFPSSKLVSPSPDARFSGTVTVDGAAWQVESWPGLVGHNWGKRHAKLYAWGHCNMFEDDKGAPIDGLVFEGTSGKVKVGPITTPLLTLLCVRYRGVKYDLSAWKYIVRNRASVSMRRWVFEGASDLVAIKGEMEADAEDFVGLQYDNPAGPATHCLNSKIARARLELTLRGRPPMTATSRAAAFEIGTLSRDHGVRIHV